MNISVNKNWFSVFNFSSKFPSFSLKNLNVQAFTATLNIIKLTQSFIKTVHSISLPIVRLNPPILSDLDNLSWWLWPRNARLSLRVFSLRLYRRRCLCSGVWLKFFFKLLELFDCHFGVFVSLSCLGLCTWIVKVQFFGRQRSVWKVICLETPLNSTVQRWSIIEGWITINITLS